MGFTIRQTILLVITVTVERLFAFGAAEMIDVKLLSQGVDYSLVLDRFLASSADGDHAHLVVAAQAIELVASFSTGLVQLGATFIAVVMPGMHRITHVHDLPPFFDICVTFMAHKPTTFRFFGGITSLAQSTT